MDMILKDNNIDVELVKYKEIMWDYLKETKRKSL